jgi:hypothetical protein
MKYRGLSAGSSSAPHAVVSNITLAVLADGEAAEGVAVEVELAQLRDRAPSQLGVGGALRDSEQQLSLRARRGALTGGPGGRPADDFGQLAARRLRRRADVEAHCDVGAEVGLDRGHRLRREVGERTVVDRAKRHALVVDVDDRVPEREHLEPAGVGENRTLPPHEAVEAAELGDQVRSRRKRRW